MKSTAINHLAVLSTLVVQCSRIDNGIDDVVYSPTPLSFPTIQTGRHPLSGYRLTRPKNLLLGAP